MGVIRRNERDSTVKDRVRVGGSGFTVFTWQSKLIGFARQVAHTSPAPVGPGPTAIHPLDEPFPVEVITPAAQGMGTLTLELYELYGKQVWEQLSELTGAVDLVDIFIKVAAMRDPISVVKYIKPPTLRGKRMQPYTEEYHGCVITNVLDGETIEVGTMEILKQMTIAYTYKTRGDSRQTWKNTSLGKNRDANSTVFG
jgi:hypothetical protein